MEEPKEEEKVRDEIDTGQIAKKDSKKGISLKKSSKTKLNPLQLP